MPDPSFLKRLEGAIVNPRWRYGFGMLAAGLSAFAWPYFPVFQGWQAFAGAFTIGVAGCAACVGRKVDGDAQSPTP